MFAVGRSGEQARFLGGGEIFSVLRDGSSDVLIIRNNLDPGRREVLSRHPYRRNTQTGRETSVETGLGKAAMQWWGDDQGRAKLAYTVSENNYILYLKSKPDQPWAEIDTGDRYGSKRGGFTPRWIAPNGDLYVSRYLDLEGTVSNTFVVEWPKGSGNLREYPEIDRVDWFSVARARSKLLTASSGLFKIISTAPRKPWASGLAESARKAASTRSKASPKWPWW